LNHVAPPIAVIDGRTTAGTGTRRMNLWVEHEELHTADERRATVLRPVGELDLHTAGVLREALEAEPADRITVVDLGRLEFIDSTGLGTLVAARQRLIAGGGALRLAGADERILRPFRLTGLLEVFEFHETLDQALGAGG
jgi:anti-sigma B factor antagonist